MSRAGLIVLALLSFSVAASDQFSYCQFSSIQTCRNDDKNCESGWTPEQVKAYLNRTPTAEHKIPGVLVDGFVQIYVANSGGIVGLQFRKYDGKYRVYLGSTDYTAWLDGGRCGVVI